VYFFTVRQYLFCLCFTLAQSQKKAVIRRARGKKGPAAPLYSKRETLRPNRFSNCFGFMLKAPNTSLEEGGAFRVRGGLFLPLLDLLAFTVSRSSREEPELFADLEVGVVCFEVAVLDDGVLPPCDGVLPPCDGVLPPCEGWSSEEDVELAVRRVSCSKGSLLPNGGGPAEVVVDERGGSGGGEGGGRGAAASAALVGGFLAGGAAWLRASRLSTSRHVCRFSSTVGRWPLRCPFFLFPFFLPLVFLGLREGRGSP